MNSWKQRVNGLSFNLVMLRLNCHCKLSAIKVVKALTEAEQEVPYTEQQSLEVARILSKINREVMHYNATDLSILLTRLGNVFSTQLEPMMITLFSCTFCSISVCYSTQAQVQAYNKNSRKTECAKLERD